MTILAQRLKELSRGLAAVDGLEPSLVAECRAAAVLADGLDPYLSRCSTPESAALAELARRTAEEDWNGRTGNGVVEQEMLSGHVEGQFLKMLVHLARAANVLDVGMFTGYSALAMAEALPADGRVIACEVDATVAAFGQRCLSESEAGRKVDVRIGPALDTLDALARAGERFDLVFLDADKAGYSAYLDAILDGDLLAAHGLVIIDNTLMQGEPWHPATPTANGATIAAFNDIVAADRRVEQVIVPLRDGVTLVRRISRI
jgi:caffeoyl-CoA O-methyltransferase